MLSQKPLRRAGKGTWFTDGWAAQSLCRWCMKWLMMVEQVVSSSNKYMARLFWYCLLGCFHDFISVSVMEFIFTWLMSLGNCVYVGKIFENCVFGILVSIWGNGKQTCSYLFMKAWNLAAGTIPFAMKGQIWVGFGVWPRIWASHNTSKPSLLSVPR